MNRHQASADPRIPPRDACVLRYTLERIAEEQPDRIYCVLEGGETWTYRQTLEKTRARAAQLAAVGVSQGDHVLLWLPNGAEALLGLLAVNYLGAVLVPINTEYRGPLLEHVIDNSDARVLLAHGSLLERLQDVNTATLDTLLCCQGEAPADVAGLPITRLEDVTGAATATEPARPIQPWDTMCVLYTSGTTGPSKGVLMSYLHLYTNAGPETWHFVTGEDRFLINMPIFHIGGLGLMFNMLVRGGSIALWNAFRTDTFWTFVRETECTAAFLLGVMATFLLKAPAAKDDRNHPLRLIFAVPLTDGAIQFHDRFDVDVYTIFNMTEISTPILSPPNPTKQGTCGKAREGVELRLVDEHDCEVPAGETGELIIRADRPWAMNHGYYKNPQATARAWRNGWFHTGDAFRQDAEGNYFFVDRIKDAIRRRGENISSFEVEAGLVAHEDVREAAAIAVPSELGEDEVMAVIAPVEGREPDLPLLVDFLAERMPHYMVPRYFRVVDELPKTPTAKVQKVRLREDGVTAQTWDREAEGIRLKRSDLN
ncbi:MAG: ATP-dependent acyl-CoA ligase [Salinisphaeraceae bacterium]|nr:ATP-dependent acyl-CoA ligase [Salinisphaeraceae bacterium]